MLIGVAVALFALLNGRIAGISGVLGGLLRPLNGDSAWRIAFVLGLVDDYYRAEAEVVLQPIRAFSELHGWKVREAYVNGAAGHAIAELAEAQKFDLIVMGTHGRSPLVTLILSSVATVVLALSKVPVLLIR